MRVRLPVNILFSLPRTSLAAAAYAILVCVPTAVHAQADDAIASPSGEGFARHSADPRALSSYLLVVNWEAPSVETRVAAVGVGDRFTIARGQARGVSLDFAAEFMVHAQFDLDGRSSDFLNADFIIGAPFSARLGPWSGAARFGHWSAHLGDEFLIRSGRERQETSMEFIELLLARDLGPARLLIGGERRLRAVPRNLPDYVARVGGDLRPGPGVGLGAVGEGRFVVSTDLRWDASTIDRPAVSIQVGMEVAPPVRGSGRRTWAVQFEFFDGTSPFGQYFLEPLRTLGVSFRLR